MTGKQALTIVGAGPAGLFAAYQLSRLSPDLEILLLVDSGQGSGENPLAVHTRAQVCPVEVNGVGGSGVFSDKLYFDPAGGWLETRTTDLSQVFLAYVAEIFEKFGGISERAAFVSNTNSVEIPGAEVKRYKRLVPLAFGDYKRFLENLAKNVVDNGVKIEFDAAVTTIIKEGTNFAFQLKSGRQVKSKNILLATGRSSAIWFEKQALALGLQISRTAPYFGVRIEAKTSSLEGLMSIGRDPKVKRSVPDGSDTKTHCVCFNGTVISCKCEDMTLVDGTSLDLPTSNTSLNILTRMPRALSTIQARSIVARIMSEGQGAPVVQRMGDFVKGVPSSSSDLQSNPVKPTLTTVQPGELTHLIPAPAVRNIVELLELMKGRFPGVVSAENLVYAPVLEWFSPKVKIDKSSAKTSVPGFYVAGDVAGVSQGVVMAAASGLWTGIKLAEIL